MEEGTRGSQSPGRPTRLRKSYARCNNSAGRQNSRCPVHVPFVGALEVYEDSSLTPPPSAAGPRRRRRPEMAILLLPGTQFWSGQCGGAGKRVPRFLGNLLFLAGKVVPVLAGVAIGWQRKTKGSAGLLRTDDADDADNCAFFSATVIAASQTHTGLQMTQKSGTYA